MPLPVLQIREALRALKRAPGFFGAAMLSLALGVGGVTAFFGLTRHFLLRPLPYAQPDRLVALGETRAIQGKVEEIAMGPSDFQAWREEARSFEHLAFFRPLGREVNAGGDPVFMPVSQVSADFFETLALHPTLGRFFTRAEEAPGQPSLVVLGHRFWVERFGSDPAVMGRSVNVAGKPYLIVGVAPAFTFPNTWIQKDPALFTLLHLGSRSEDRQHHQYQGIGRLRPGVRIETALGELVLVQAHQEAAFPDTNTGNGASLKDLRASLYGDRSRALGLLTGASSLLLLMACLNGASLFLARGIAKSRETALRAALGARTPQLFAPFLAEGLITALGGAFGGLLLAGWLLTLLPRLLKDAVPLPGAAAPSLDLGLLVFALAVSLLSSLAVSLLPVLRARSADLMAELREGSRGAGVGGGRLRGTLLAIEVALSVVLLAGTGLLLRSMGHLMARDLGFEPKGLVCFLVDVNTPTLRQTAPMEAFRRTLLDRVRALPGVKDAGIASHSPVDGLGEFSQIRLGSSEAPRSGDPEVPTLSVSENALETMGVKLLQGRAIAASDGPGAPAVALVNQAFAARFFPHGDALGQMIRTSYLDAPVRVVGVVSNLRHGGPANDVAPVLIYAVGQWLNGEFIVVLRTSRSLADLRKALDEAVLAADGSRKPIGLCRIADELRESLADRRNTLILLGAFAALALTLAAVGIYGIAAYAVAQRRREIGIRLALGGDRTSVVRDTLRREMAFVGVGAGLGLIASIGLGKVLKAQLVGIGSADPIALFGALAVLALVAALAILLPALRAARTQPSETLRSE